MAESKLRGEKKERQRAQFARMSPAERLSLGAELSAAGKALLVREAGPETDRTEPFRTLALVLDLLRAQKSPHALIGGWAVNVWGVSRATADIDLLMMDGLVRARPRDGTGISLDILRAAKAADRQALERVATISFQGLEIPVVRPEDLIAMKLDAGGGLDWEDARAVYEVQGASLDASMLETACDSRGVLDRLELLKHPRKA